jgi:hypothetical protein
MARSLFVAPAAEGVGPFGISEDMNRTGRSFVY